MKNTLKTRWLRLIFTSLVLLLSGIIYAWTTIKKPFDAFDWTATQLMFNYTLTMCMFCISGFVSGLLSKKLSTTVRLIAAAVLACGGLILVSTVDADSIWKLYLGYGFMTGTGVGIVYNVVISATTAWFTDKKGIASGCMMMGFGLGSFILGLIADKLFDMESFGWEKTYVLFGILLGVIILAAAFIVKFPSKDVVIPAGKKANQSVPDIATRDVVRRSSFIKLFIFFMLFASVGSTAIADAKGIMSDVGVTSSAVAVLALLVPVCNALGRISCGLIFDSFGLRFTQFCTSGVVIGATAITLIGVITSSSVVGVAGLLLCGFSYGFSPTVSSAFTAQFYGMKHFSLNFSLLNLILIPASFMPTLSGSLVTSTGSYVPTFIILVSVSVVGLIINATIKKA